MLKGHIALLGGSFNPPHAAHQLACLYLLEGLGVDRVWLLPSFVHPFGKSLASFEHRVQMCRLMAAPFGDRVAVCEIEREIDAGGLTFHTIERLQAEHPSTRFAWIIGSDILKEVEHWYRWNELRARVRVFVLRRGGFLISGDCECAPVELPEISSTLIRERLQTGQSVEGLVTRAVAKFIESERLYVDASNPA